MRGESPDFGLGAPIHSKITCYSLALSKTLTRKRRESVATVDNTLLTSPVSVGAQMDGDAQEDPSTVRKEAPMGEMAAEGQAGSCRSSRKMTTEEEMLH